MHTANMCFASSAMSRPEPAEIAPTGLSAAEAAARLAEVGANELAQEAGPRW